MLATNLLMKALLSGLAGVIFLLGCKSEVNDGLQSETVEEPIAGYLWESPTKKYFMPYELDEISGLASYKKGQLVCVQDEEGTLFIYDLKEGKVTQRIRFAKDGDYEGVAMVNRDVVVVRSDGTLFEVTRKNEASSVAISTSLSIKNDVEGLSYDRKTKQLLLACKEQPGLGKEDLKGKSVYTYDLGTKKLVEKPRFLLKSKDLELVLKTKGIERKVKNFKPSGLDIHPKTGQVFIIASVGKILVILEPDGTIVEVINLKPKIFKQPEGICFDPDGTLYISSEGSPGYILEFAYNG